jgi:enterochelin esterase family protein
MRFIHITIFFSILTIFPLFSQSQFELFIQHVNSLPDSGSKAVAVDSFITYARTKGIPFIENNTANYFLRGSFNTVEITGDFNEFYPYLDLTRLTGTDFFYYSHQYELNARLDYEFRINSSVIINDPENPDSIPGYYGYNSELAMPEYIQPWEIEHDSSILHGTIINTSIYSNIVSKSYELKIFVPAEYNSSSSDYPSVYFQDGSSYTDWGNAINVLDNLIAYNKIVPVIGVFVVPNDRSQEYAFGLRNAYSQFFVTELVPFIDNAYRTITQASQRLVMGDSYGGNISALISYNYPDVFGNCGLQSAALHPNNYEVYNLLTAGDVKNIKFSTIWGSYDARDGYLTVLKDSLISRGYKTDWLVLPEGHSWGLWRATIDTMLQYFFPPVQPTTIQVTVNTSPSGRSFIVDEQSYSSSQIFGWASESTHTISTTAIQSGVTGIRYIFQNWSDSGDISHSITPANSSTFTADFNTEYFLSVIGSAGGSIDLTNNWYSANSQVQIKAIPDSGYYFAGWVGTGNGSYTGTNNPVIITMNEPITQEAVFNLMPIIAPSNLNGQLVENPLSFELSWIDNSDNEDGFIIERESSIGNSFTVLDSVNQNITSYIDFSVDTFTYRYRIKAYNQFTQSAYSDTFQIVTPVEFISFSLSLANSGVLVQWVTTTEINNLGYTVERNTNTHWEKITFINGGGNSNHLNIYQYLDDFTKFFYKGNVIYRLKQMNYDGTYIYSENKEIEVDFAPQNYSLSQNYPNPFNPSTKIKYTIPTPPLNPSPSQGEGQGVRFVTLKVFDILGNEIATLVNEIQPAGSYEVEFNVAYESLRTMASGIYFYKLKAGNFVESKKMIYLK